MHPSEDSMSSTYTHLSSRYTIGTPHTPQLSIHHRFTSALHTSVDSMPNTYIPLTSRFSIDTPHLLSPDILSSTAPKSMYISMKRMYTCKYVSHAVRMHIYVACGAYVYVSSTMEEVGCWRQSAAPVSPLLQPAVSVLYYGRGCWRQAAALLARGLVRSWPRPPLGSSRKPNLHRPNPTY